MSVLETRPTTIPIRGIQKIELVPIGDVDQFIFKYPEPDFVQIILKENKFWQNIYFSYRSLSIKPTTEDTPAGLTYTYIISFFIPYNRVEASTALNLKRMRHFFCRVHFASGIKLIFGEPENAMLFHARETVAAAPAETDGYQIELSVTMGSPFKYDAVAG